ncbi:hypothetical protein B5P46_11725 [Rhizobium leguminosarum]|uniref:Helix-turn-helix domain-containing protein n=1 Tax=Rhizobium leguminosarum TaxID=384 RepID=A0A4Q1UBI3_RHILE|nr:helix-turn-helix transcriptional regulator [Rhizobium leguminosarum]RXT29344.1 hypothetical protein B5P46_11725 [Rhizobium leguminosarum]
MHITWKTVDEWREERGMEKAELARRANVSERTIYNGLSKNSRLQPSTKSNIRSIFPDKFDDRGEVRQ